MWQLGLRLVPFFAAAILLGYQVMFSRGGSRRHKIAACALFLICGPVFVITMVLLFQHEEWTRAYVGHVVTAHIFFFFFFVTEILGLMAVKGDLSPRVRQLHPWFGYATIVAFCLATLTALFV